MGSISFPIWVPRANEWDWEFYEKENFQTAKKVLRNSKNNFENELGTIYKQNFNIKVNFRIRQQNYVLYTSLLWLGHGGRGIAPLNEQINKIPLFFWSEALELHNLSWV